MFSVHLLVSPVPILLGIFEMYKAISLNIYDTNNLSYYLVPYFCLVGFINIAYGALLFCYLIETGYRQVGTLYIDSAIYLIFLMKLILGIASLVMLMFHSKLELLCLFESIFTIFSFGVLYGVTLNNELRVVLKLSEVYINHDLGTRLIE